MNGGFQFIAFQTNFQQEIDVEEEPVVDLLPVVTPPVDFVISSPYYMHPIQLYRNPKVEKKQDEKELMEMIQMYAIVTKATRVRA